jgi:hypothetical protein
MEMQWCESLSRCVTDQDGLTTRIVVLRGFRVALNPNSRQFNKSAKALVGDARSRQTPEADATLGGEADPATGGTLGLSLGILYRKFAPNCGDN